jgi:hypothetical protein
MAERPLLHTVAVGLSWRTASADLRDRCRASANHELLNLEFLGEDRLGLEVLSIRGQEAIGDHAVEARIDARALGEAGMEAKDQGGAKTLLRYGLGLGADLDVDDGVEDRGHLWFSLAL